MNVFYIAVRILFPSLAVFLAIAPVFAVEANSKGVEPLHKYAVPSSGPAQAIWKIEDRDIFKNPIVYPADIGNFIEKDGIKPIFYEGVPFEGTPTRVFAWLGIPESDNGPLPAIVLVHGGGGTAYRDWVKLWMNRGYAAIAMDTNGSVPISSEGMTAGGVRHPYSPETGIYFQNSTKLSPPSQWAYHAVSAVIRANSLLRSLPQVDSERIGITGISWGGILTEIAVGIDSRFKFAAPVYGCGFLGENSFWVVNDFKKLPTEEVSQWLTSWDPSEYLGKVTTPLLFCNGTNDKFFPPDSWQKTTLLPKGPVTRSLKVGMAHAHPPAGDPKEVAVFADSYGKGGAPLPQICNQGEEGNSAWISYNMQIPIKSANLVYTCDTGDWVTRKWQQSPAEIKGDRIVAPVPPECTVYFFNVYDARGCSVSSQYKMQGHP